MLIGSMVVIHMFQSRSKISAYAQLDDITCLAVNDFITLTLLAGSSVILVCWV